jgi:hypothetical protein
MQQLNNSGWSIYDARVLSFSTVQNWGKKDSENYDKRDLTEV